jgi:hypothetical protein
VTGLKDEHGRRGLFFFFFFRFSFFLASLTSVLNVSLCFFFFFLIHSFLRGVEFL